MINYQNASMDDIIFEGRNKQYGAYELRQNIDRHSFIGLLFTVSAFTIIMLVYNADFFRTNHLTPIEKVLTFNTTEIVLEEEIVKPKPVVQNTAPLPSVVKKFTDYSVVQDNVPTTNVNTQADVFDKPVGTEEIINPLGTEIASYTPTTSGTGTEIVETIEKPVVINTNIIKSYVEVMPTYKGGKEAMMDYLKNNIHPFDADREDRLVGKVIIRFYVDVDGTVRNPEVLKDNVGGRCAEAAISAVKKMPKWNPGMQGNSPVKVYFTLPVSFDLSKF